MRTPLLLLCQLSTRSVLRQRRRSFTLVAAIAFCVGIMLVTSAMIRGLVVGSMETSVLSMVGDVRVVAPAFVQDPALQHAFTAPTAVLEMAQTQELMYATRLVLPAAIRSERRAAGLQLVGADMDEEARTSFLATAQIAGELPSGATSTGVLLGQKLVDKLKTRLGKRVLLQVEDAAGEGLEFGVRIVGVFTADVPGVEEAFAFIGRDTLQRKVGAPVITEVSLRTAPTDRAALAAQIRPLLTSSAVTANNTANLEVLTWEEAEPTAAGFMELASAASGVWSLVLLLALSFGLINTMITAVIERTREFGMMGVLGMRRRAILVQVLLESVWLVILGLIGGLIFAGLSFWWLADGIDLTSFGAGLNSLNFSSMLELRPEASDISNTIGSVVVLALAAAIYPAWRATRINPLSAMKGPQP